MTRPEVGSFEAPDFARLPIGARVGDRFKVEQLLARGAISTVLRASDELCGRAVVLKAMDPLRARDPLARQRFLRELDVLTRISHPGIAQVLGLEHIEGTDVLVLEYVEGETIAERLERGRMSAQQATRIAAGLCQALDACHKVGVIHRDLKPANVVLHPDRGPVVLDFGMAWFTSAMTLTRTGAVVGSPRYVAPELFESGHGDERVDVFGVGAILYEMLTGRPVRTEESVTQMATSRAPPASPRSMGLEVERSLDRVVMRAIERRPELRFFTVKELLAALEGRTGESSLEAQVACPRCASPRIVDLPICPGCGARAEWRIQPGPFAVEVVETKEPGAALGFLARRRRELVPSSLAERLEQPPFPLAVGVSEASAELLVAEAARAGLRAEIVRAGAFGPPLRLAAPRPSEVFRLAGLHLAAVLTLAVSGGAAGAPALALRALPFVVTAAILFAWLKRARRPMIPIPTDPESTPHPALAGLAIRLESLRSPRSRGIAAGAIARAAPVLLGDVKGLPDAAQEEALAQLELAVDSSVEADRMAEAITKHQRGAHGRDVVVDARDAALRHDLAVRRALEAAESITRALGVRTLPAEV
ncbi:MAG: serine/threonine protein kinase [Deltaproteobacteria bacterium]|nr:serine/threonine protein kinase [Deltaproteobacteria bacterium]